MKIDDFKRMRPLGERKVEDESNLRDMSEVSVTQYEQGGDRFEVDEKNGRFRKFDGSARSLGHWEKLER